MIKISDQPKKGKKKKAASFQKRLDDYWPKGTPNFGCGVPLQKTPPRG
jgi:hypothetical protein